MSKKKYNTKLIKHIFSGFFAIVILFWLFQIDYNNVFSKENSGAIFGVLAGVLIIVSLQLKTKEPKE